MKYTKSTNYMSFINLLI